MNNDNGLAWSGEMDHGGPHPPAKGSRSRQRGEGPIRKDGPTRAGDPSRVETDRKPPVSFWVEGLPAPEPRPRSGLRRFYVPKSADPWKDEVRAVAVGALRRRIGRGEPPWETSRETAYAVRMHFRFARPVSHYHKRVRDAARPAHPGSRSILRENMLAERWITAALKPRMLAAHLQAPDVDNLAKAVLDALQPWGGLPAVLWPDDSNVTTLLVRKSWVPFGSPSGLHLTVKPVDMEHAPEQLDETVEELEIPPIVLTLGERFTVVRRRLGQTIAEAARAHRVPTHRASEWESGRRVDVPVLEVDAIEPHEWCMITRRRQGRRLVDVAVALGVSPAWVTRVERGDASPGNVRTLVEYWLERDVDDVVADLIG